MSDLFWLTDEQMERLRQFFPRSHGKPRVDDRRVLSGIVFVNRNGLRWRDAPSAYGSHKTLYNRWKRWGERGVFTRMMEGLAAGDAEPKTVMICWSRLSRSTMVNLESSRDGARFNQIPSIAIKVLEDGHDAIRFTARLLDEPNAPLGKGKVVTGEVIGFEEQEHPTATLIADRSTLPVTDSPRQ